MNFITYETDWPVDERLLRQVIAPGMRARLAHKEHFSIRPNSNPACPAARVRYDVGGNFWLLFYDPAWDEADRALVVGDLFALSSRGTAQPGVNFRELPGALGVELYSTADAARDRFQRQQMDDDLTALITIIIGRGGAVEFKPVEPAVVSVAGLPGGGHIARLHSVGGDVVCVLAVGKSDWLARVAAGDVLRRMRLSLPFDPPSDVEVERGTGGARVGFRHPEQQIGELFLCNERDDSGMAARLSRIRYRSPRVGKRAFRFDDNLREVVPMTDPQVVPVFVPISAIRDVGDDPAEVCRGRYFDWVEILFEPVEHSRDPKAAAATTGGVWFDRPSVLLQPGDVCAAFRRGDLRILLIRDEDDDLLYELRCSHGMVIAFHKGLTHEAAMARAAEVITAYGEAAAPVRSHPLATSDQATGELTDHEARLISVLEGIVGWIEGSFPDPDDRPLSLIAEAEAAMAAVRQSGGAHES